MQLEASHLPNRPETRALQKELRMEKIKALCPQDAEWDEAAAYVQACPWAGGCSLERRMQDGFFDRENRLFIAYVDDAPAGFCTLADDDGLVDDDPAHTLYIGYVWVSEEFRGRRLSERIIVAASEMARQRGIDMVYIRTGHQGLYEKFGFRRIGTAHNTHGELETVFARETARNTE